MLYNKKNAPADIFYSACRWRSIKMFAASFLDKYRICLFKWPDQIEVDELQNSGHLDCSFCHQADCFTISASHGIQYNTQFSHTLLHLYGMQDNLICMARRWNDGYRSGRKKEREKERKKERKKKKECTHAWYTLPKKAIIWAWLLLLTLTLRWPVSTYGVPILE